MRIKLSKWEGEAEREGMRRGCSVFADDYGDSLMDLDAMPGDMSSIIVYRSEANASA